MEVFRGFRCHGCLFKCSNHLHHAAPPTVYHYVLTVEVADLKGAGGSAHGRLQVSLITEDGEIKDFDLSKE